MSQHSASPRRLPATSAWSCFTEARGAPNCNAQLRAFQRAHDSLTQVEAKIVAISVDDEATARALIAKHRLEYPVGHSADARAIAAATGAFVDDEPTFIQSTGFVLDPTGPVFDDILRAGRRVGLISTSVVPLVGSNCRHCRDGVPLSRLTVLHGGH